MRKRKVVSASIMRAVPVVLMTASSERVSQGQLDAAGADRILVKPFEPEALLALVKELAG